MKHQIVLLHSNGEAVLLTRRFAKAFNDSAYLWFADEANKHFGNMTPVLDNTLAGRHYRNDDGTVVLELR